MPENAGWFQGALGDAGRGWVVSAYATELIAVRDSDGAMPQCGADTFSPSMDMKGVDPGPLLALEVLQIW